MHVVDDGALLHRVTWPKKATYKTIASHYVLYAKTKYGCCCIVFDGYGNGPSTKDPEHKRRVGKTCADVYLEESMAAHNNKEIFLSNDKNKSKFISLPTEYLQADV